MRPRLGQHFLRDRRVLEDILAAALIQAGERVLEIGPGPGALTKGLSEAAGPGGRVVAVEADAALAAAMEGRFGNVEVVHADAVQMDLAGLARRFDAVVANLPYRISGPITIRLLRLLDDPTTAWDRAVLMYQREFAKRLGAGPGSRDYGRLSVQAARRVHVDRVRDVAPGCFDPPPRVESQVLLLTPLEAPLGVANEELWDAVIDGAFSKRRKQLRNALPPALVPHGVPAPVAEAVLEARGWAAKRAEDLAPEDFAALVEDLVQAIP